MRYSHLTWEGDVTMIGSNRYFYLSLFLVLLAITNTASAGKTVVKQQVSNGTKNLVGDANGNNSQSRSGEQIEWQVISSGGENEGASESYNLSSTVGQSAVGSGSSESFILTHGFWQDFHVPVMGDTDGSGGVDIDDIVFLIAYVFQGGPAPSPLSIADVDCSGGIDIDDIVYLIAYVFQGGFAPGDPDGNGVPDC